ncbi:MAG: TRAP transporter small permease [Gammaproteobacteria bacterium]|nr:TRAP transporter small permease [Gammaproteobacteria bacterium]MDE0252512.1 TRAP transporter small permease [Gammaproteobacteria bacterium]MDE0403004.1 TRAP transporter small permease [Gammaproteobacteria bacterium]
MSTVGTAKQDCLGTTLQFLDAFLSKIENASNILAGVLIFGLMCLGVVGIVLQAFKLSTFGFHDVVEFSMVGFAVLSISYVQRVGAHVRMELILSKLRGRLLWFVEGMSALLAGAIVLILIPSSYQHFQRAFEYGDSTMNIELVTWPAKLVVPVALSILLLRIGIQFIGYLRMFLNPTVPPIAIPIVQSPLDQMNSDQPSSQSTLA